MAVKETWPWPNFACQPSRAKASLGAFKRNVNRWPTMSEVSSSLSGMANLVLDEAFSATKLKQLVLYITKACETDKTVGRVKLAKLLYYVDMEAYRQLGKSLTNATYQKLPQGPGSTQFMPIKRELLEDGWVDEIAINPGTRYETQKLMALREPDPAAFSEEERTVVDAVLTRFKGWTAKKMSDLSHEEIGWIASDMNEVIPNHAYLLAPHLSEAEVQRAEAMARKLDLIGAE